MNEGCVVQADVKPPHILQCYRAMCLARLTGTVAEDDPCDSCPERCFALEDANVRQRVGRTNERC